MSGPTIAKVNDARRLRAAVAIAVDDMAAHIEWLESEVSRLKTENRDLWESVHELQAIAERAHT